MPQAKYSSVQLDHPDLEHMSNLEILEAVRSIERNHHGASFERDHRRHLSREELLNVYRLARRAIELRRIARERKNSTTLVNH